MIHGGTKNRLLFAALISALLSAVYLDRNPLLVEAFSSTKSSSTNYYNVNSRNHHQILTGITGPEERRTTLHSHYGRKSNPLFSHKEKNDSVFVGGGGGRRRRSKFLIHTLISRTAHSLKQMRISTIRSKVRRAVVVFSTVAFLWLGSANTQTSPCHASSSAASSTISEPIVVCVSNKNSATAAYKRPMFTSSFDQIIDKYVKDHMFDDDAYDAIESTYIEAYSDTGDKLYRDQLEKITENVVGAEGLKPDEELSRGVKEKLQLNNLLQTAFTGSLSFVMTCASFLNNFMVNTLGISKGTALAVSVASAIVGVVYTSATAFIGILNAFKTSTDRSLNKTYKGKFNVSSKEKIQDDDDDDDDASDDDDEDDDDSDDEEDDDDDDDED